VTEGGAWRAFDSVTVCGRSKDTEGDGRNNAAAAGDDTTFLSSNMPFYKTQI